MIFSIDNDKLVVDNDKWWRCVMKNIITISGNLGSGKSTMGKILSENLNLSVYASGDVMRHLAQKKNMDINEFVEFLSSHKEYDALIDNEVANIAKEKNNLLFVSRMAWYFIPQSFKVFLYVDESVGAERIINDKLRNAEKYLSYEEAFNAIKLRFVKSRKRFIELYGVDICDPSNYDLYLDTTNMSIIDVKNVILKSYYEYMMYGGEKRHGKAFINYKYKD